MAGFILSQQRTSVQIRRPAVVRFLVRLGLDQWKPTMERRRRFFALSILPKTAQLLIISSTGC